MRVRTASRVVPKAVLPAAAMPEAVAFYRRLGFAVEAFDEGYAWVTHHGEELLHLRLVPGLDVRQNPASCYLHVEDPDAWHAAWAAEGVAVGTLADTAWGMREFAVTDPAGNLLRVGANS